ncbi:MAG: helix-turn-helix transcriptional regulator [Bacteriovoracaceae bacterium]|nr:helix-turn-helix transcriptional regulator [Bacteriovoracaceae bacterium]
MFDFDLSIEKLTLKSLEKIFFYISILAVVNVGVAISQHQGSPELLFPVEMAAFCTLLCYMGARYAWMSSNTIINIFYLHMLLNHIFRVGFFYRDLSLLFFPVFILLNAFLFSKKRYMVFYSIFLIVLILADWQRFEINGHEGLFSRDLRNVGGMLMLIFIIVSQTFFAYLFCLHRERLVNALTSDKLSGISKYKKSNYTQEELVALSKDVYSYLQTSKNYLNPELRVTDLSQRFNLPLYKISQVLNIGLQQNFTEVVMKLRIEEAMNRLRDPKFQEDKILSIAMDCGFVSKSTFNTAFKNYTGLTPSQFREKFQKSS